MRRFYKRWLQRPLRLLLYGGFRIILLGFRLLGPALSRRLARSIGRTAGTILPYERRLALDHLCQAFPERSDVELRQVRRAMFVHLGECGAEAVHIQRTLATTTIAGTAELLQAAANGGAIVIGGHIGNWEVLGAAVAKAGVPLTVVARRIYDPRLDRWMRAWRNQFDIETVVRDMPGTTKALIGALKRNRVIVMLIDQDTDVPSVWVDFFGRPAKTPSGPARLAEHGTPVFLATIERTAPWTHVGRIEPFTDLPTGIEARTQRFSDALEAQIRRRPQQWVWLHRRWRSAPEPAENA